MKVTAAGINLIKHFEGCRLEAYLDSAGVLTIGYGHIANVVPGMRITQDDAERLLAADIDTKAIGVRALIDTEHIDLTDNEFSALVSFAFNLGLLALRRSTLLKKVNACDPTAADEFGKWILCNGKALPGLVERRAAEAALFRIPVTEETHA